MPAVTTAEATERLARSVERAKPDILVDIYGELFPERMAPTVPIASDLARQIRGGLKPEELVDLWNVVFPDDRHVWYDEEEKTIRFNEELVGYED